MLLLGKSTKKGWLFLTIPNKSYNRKLCNKSIKNNNKETNKSTIPAKTNHTIESIKYRTRHIMLAMIQDNIPIIKPKCALSIISTPLPILLYILT